MRFQITAAALALALTGCGSPTPYQPKAYAGGYTEEKLGDDIYLVEFAGNAFISRPKVTVYAYRRAEEVCRADGFSGYETLDEIQAGSGQFARVTVKVRCTG